MQIRSYKLRPASHLPFPPPQFAPGELNEEIESVPFEALSPEIQEQLKKLQVRMFMPRGRKIH